MLTGAAKERLIVRIWEGLSGRKRGSVGITLGQACHV